MPFCDYCDTEQAGVPNGLGTLYCVTCGLTISELYVVEEQTLKEAAKAASYSDMAKSTYEKREAQKLARKQKRQQRASGAKNAVPARTAAKASVGTLNKEATMSFCVYCESEQDGILDDWLRALYCSSCGMTISELYYDFELVTSSKGPGGLEQDLKEAAKEASYNDMAEATYKKREAQKLARKQKRQQRASDAKNAVPARTAAKASVGTLNKKATMLFCVYCETEQAGMPDGHGGLYCSYCGLTISEEYLVEEVAFSKGSGGLEQDLKDAAKAAVAGVASTRGDQGRESGKTGNKAAHADVQRRSSRLPIRTKRYPDTDYVH